MRVLHVATEAFPYVKVGGLSDVLGALPPALRQLGIDARLLLPGYPGVLEGAAPLSEIATLDGLPGAGTARLLGGTTDRGVPLYVLDVPALFSRSRDPYADFGDSHLQAAALSGAAARLGREGDGRGFFPELLHCHDWQTALAPAYLRYAGVSLPSVLTIHNLAYQGVFSPDVLPSLGVPADAFRPDGLEFWGRINLLKGGLLFASRLTTVSPTYAREVQTSSGGHGLDGVLRARAADLHGILNGIDEAIWNPGASPHLAAPFDAMHLAMRARNKTALQHELGLEPNANAPLFGIVSRLNALKGIDLVVDNVPHLVGLGGQLAVLGKGDEALEHALDAACARFPGSVAIRFGQREALAHRIFGGSDAILVPSRSEPCGLVQMYAMRHGALPIVRYIGGLADTVQDETTGSGATGFTFDAADGFALGAAITRAETVYRAAAARWQEMQLAAMSRDFGWKESASRYAEVYRSTRPSETASSVVGLVPRGVADG